MGKFTALEKADAAKREAGYRRYVYPRRVSDGKMSQENADKQIAIMDEIEAEYRAQVPPPAQGELL